MSADPTDYSIAKDDTIKVAADRDARPLRRLARDERCAAARLNHLAFKKPVLIGHKIKLEFAKVSREEFEQKRREYHRDAAGELFRGASHRRHRDLSCAPRRFGLDGDQHNSELPLWLLQQYNPDLDLSDMHPGTQIVVPKIEEVGPRGA